MQALSKTAALRTASKAVSIHGRGTSWTIISPHDHGNVGGAYTQCSADSYSKAVATAARIKASLTLTLMGLWSEDADAAIYCEMDVRDTRGLVDIGLRAAAARA